MTVLATARPIREQAPHIATCRRCGIERMVHSTRQVADLCRDCRDVEADLNGHGSVAGWSRHHRTGDLPVCEACRDAYREHRKAQR